MSRPTPNFTAPETNPAETLASHPCWVHSLKLCPLLPKRIKGRRLSAENSVESPLSPHTSGRTRPRMGSVNTPATPTTPLGLATFSPARTQPYLPSYVGTHPATYGVCQHAGYSYDMCDLNTISQYHPSYDGTHPASYGVCQHAGYSYDTCDLSFGPGYILTSPHTTISPLIRRDAPGHVWGLSTLRLLLRHVRPHFGLGYILTSHLLFALGLGTFSPAHTCSKASTQSQGLHRVVHQHIITLGPSNGPNLANPKNTRYAISVRDSNGIPK
ncbi:unnamed protein product [Prunus brigantina]